MHGQYEVEDVIDLDRNVFVSVEIVTLETSVSLLHRSSS